jgi:hypothetical protein
MSRNLGPFEKTGLVLFVGIGLYLLGTLGSAIVIGAAVIATAIMTARK